MCVLPFSSGNTFSKPRWSPHGNERGDLLTEAIQPSLFLGPFVVGFIAAPMASPAVCAIFCQAKSGVLHFNGLFWQRAPFACKMFLLAPFPFLLKTQKQNKTKPVQTLRSGPWMLLTGRQALVIDWRSCFPLPHTYVPPFLQRPFVEGILGVRSLKAPSLSPVPRRLIVLI